MKRLIVEPMADVPADPRAYRCLVCRTVVPWSVWTAEQREQWEWDGEKPQCCPACENTRPAPGDAVVVWDERDG